MSAEETNTTTKKSTKDSNFANFSIKFDLSDAKQKKLFEKLNQCRNYLSNGDANKKTIPKRGKDIVKGDEVFFLALEAFNIIDLVPALKKRLDENKEKKGEVIHKLWNEDNQSSVSFFGFLTEHYSSLSENEIDKLLSSSIPKNSKPFKADAGLNTVQ